MRELRKPLTAADAQAKATDCRQMAEHALKPEHRTMLEHMAETWERLAKNLMTDGG
jgi:hypothetical protein